ncbi:SufD family Fe-S cluster assembly protein [bacterium]|jgi:Fe-S cluster assembly scaffold protein SufB|nr:SufD family Fe-S cluster assembly protein [bacterium]
MNNLINASGSLNELLEKNTGANFVVEKNSNVKISGSFENASTISFELEENSHLDLAIDETKNNHAINAKLIFKLLGSGAKLTAKINVCGTDNRKIRISTTQEHVHSDTASNLEIRSALQDDSQFECHSTVRVPAHLENIEARQVNRNIIIGGNPQVKTRPALEVKTQNAMCSHGAVTKRLNANDLMYLQSRGLSKDAAIRSFLAAFLNI